MEGPALLPRSKGGKGLHGGENLIGLDVVAVFSKCPTPGIEKHNVGDPVHPEAVGQQAVVIHIFEDADRPVNAAVEIVGEKDFLLDFLAAGALFATEVDP